MIQLPSARRRTSKELPRANEAPTRRPTPGATNRPQRKPSPTPIGPQRKATPREIGVVVEVGPALGAHTGPGAVAVAFLSAR